MRRPVIAAAAGVALGLLAAAPAGAHVQVRPAEVAPGDPVLWTVLVPSEQDTGTRSVELAVPKDVIPFSYEDAPGWRRTVRTNPDGSIRSIRWRGTTRADGLATFRFLASTPERPGKIAWKALQTYRDGEIVRWIGAAGSETPASVTRVSASAPRENAGGEGGGSAAASAGAGASSDPRPVAATSAVDPRPDWLARGLGLGAILLALGGVGLARGRRS